MWQILLEWTYNICLYHVSNTIIITIYLPIIVFFFVVTNEYSCKNKALCRHEMLNISSTWRAFSSLFDPVAAQAYTTSAAALVQCCTMKYNLIKCYEGFGIFLSSDKRLPCKHISFLGWCCKAPQAAMWVPQSWTQNILFSVKHIFGTTSGFIPC